MATSMFNAVKAFDSGMLELNALTYYAYRFVVGYGFGYALGKLIW